MNRQSRGYINEESAPKDALSIYAHMRAYLITIACRACGGSSCNATERSPERRRRARLPLSGTVLLQKRNEPHPSGNPGTYPTAALWSRAGTGSCPQPRVPDYSARGASNRTLRLSPLRLGSCPYRLSDRG